MSSSSSRSTHQSGLLTDQFDSLVDGGDGAGNREHFELLRIGALVRRHDCQPRLYSTQIQ